MGPRKPGTGKGAPRVRADSWAEAPLQGPRGRPQQPGSQAVRIGRRGLALWAPRVQGLSPLPADLLEGKLLWGEGER